MKRYQSQLSFGATMSLIVFIILPMVGGMPLSITTPVAISGRITWGGVRLPYPANFSISQPVAPGKVESLDEEILISQNHILSGTGNDTINTTTHQPNIEDKLSSSSDWIIPPTPHNQTTSPPPLPVGGILHDSNDGILAEFAKLQVNGVPRAWSQTEMGSTISTIRRMRNPTDFLKRNRARLQKYWVPTLISESVSSKEEKWFGVESTVVFELNPNSLENITRAQLQLKIKPKPSNKSKNDTSLLLYGDFQRLDTPLVHTVGPIIDSVTVDPKTQIANFRISNFLRNCPKEAISGEPRIRIVFTVRRACDYGLCEEVADPDAEDEGIIILKNSGLVQSENYLKVDYLSQIPPTADINNNLAEPNNNIIQF